MKHEINYACRFKINLFKADCKSSQNNKIYMITPRWNECMIGNFGVQKQNHCKMFNGNLDFISKILLSGVLQLLPETRNWSEP